MAQKKKIKPARPFAEGAAPLISAEGTAHEAGVILGYYWGESLILHARNWTGDAKPWWMDKRFAKLISKYAPHLPDLYRGMAKGAGVKEEKVGDPAPAPEVACDCCTSFAIQPSATIDGAPISGQTKDTTAVRQFNYQVMRLKLKDAPSALSLTYPGWLFGHGFVKGGCSIFRNSVFAGSSEGFLPFNVWGLLALHCKTVDEAVELAVKYGVSVSGHCTIADEGGGIAGIEWGAGGHAVLKGKNGIYTHANAISSGKKALLKHEQKGGWGPLNSHQREENLRRNLEADHGRLTAQLCLMALCDHTNYPMSICRHESVGAMTTAAVVLEPARGLMHVTCGSPCQNWPKTYEL